MNKNTTAASGVAEGEIGRARGSEPCLLTSLFGFGWGAYYNDPANLTATEKEGPNP